MTRVRRARRREADAAALDESEHAAQEPGDPRVLLRLGDGGGLSQGQPGAPDAAAEVASRRRSTGSRAPRPRRSWRPPRPSASGGSRTSASAPASAIASCAGCKGGTSSVRAGCGSAPTSPRVAASAGCPSCPSWSRSRARSARPLQRDEYVIPAQRWRDPGANLRRGDLSSAAVVEPGAAHGGDGARRARRHSRACPPARRCGTPSAITSRGTQGSRKRRRCSGTRTSGPRRPTRERRRSTSWRPRSRAFASPRKTNSVLPPRWRRREPAQGADRNRTGVHGFAGRCVATPPRRRGRGTW